MFMQMLRTVSAVLSVSFATVAAAGDFDGALPLTCAVQYSHDCLPTKASCEATVPKNTNASIMGIDFAKKKIRSPYRKELLPVKNATTNPDSLVLQGSDQFIAWSGLVDRKTGALTVALADREGAYVYFGTCKVAEKK
jgi:hypothetical protein